ncbi:hypothetical protein CABS01_00392 [Colletotrichum abscissum]|nr:uncharacterized protein CCOS01_02235 [Colletotrichum costaricense]XP_060387412.1 uncharacterized protein CTAM01_01837 [Colletotrichum tamarilloi]XP_060406287.1 uncharacterized protein CABS01_00392 [Colletotrichum abscissum]KAK1509714.1 hypothetical protein CTAM01_01837 [Colletotrichum tamarilloi]KAK1525303.1 hypothetical protein CABS01_00392 [Colletotrichum abscissum]KAK1536915.1 hypothetical protein CCOS01_02235 [Colletotrichum costaricense]
MEAPKLGSVLFDYPMSARGGSRPPPRGRPNKVTKPTAGLKRDAHGRASRHSSVAADQLEQLAHDAEAEAEHEDDDEITAPPQHHQHHHQQQHHPHPFDLATAGILANGPPGTVPGADPDIHPDLHSLPAQFAMEAQMGGHGPGGMSRTAEDLASESGYGQLLIDSALAKRLANNEGERLAVQRRQDQTLNLKRRSNVEALLAHVSGQEAHSPCKSCHKGYGPWNGCVVVSGQMCGSCANCWFNASGSRCSFHENNLPQHMPAIQLQPVPQVSANTSFAGTAPMAPGMAPAGPSFGQPGADPTIAHFVKDVLERAMTEARSDNPHVRFQLRIETAARQLALASAEYAEFLAQQGGHDPSQHPDPEGSVPEAAMGEGDNGA